MPLSSLVTDVKINTKARERPLTTATDKEKKMVSPGGGICWRKAAILAGAIIALVIGSGFATGQELFQYVTAYGLQCIFAILFIGCVGAALLAFMVRKNIMDRKPKVVSSPRPNYGVWYLMKNGTPLPDEEVSS
ncbi:hypothetical protein [Adlercreutzia sp. ZJ141]|uniref:hypothetical protein n=1 Tax=Adlercreutzia sp. ZJ141 TaxID=2709406 RepID=UPI0013ED7FD5|nr:hypothetical protein [Adlercreutzia sp. ZJ141]